MSKSEFKMPEPGDLWCHYRQDPESPSEKLYQIVKIAICTETGEPRVIYHPQGEPEGEWFDRPLSVFLQHLGRGKSRRFTFHTRG